MIYGELLFDNHSNQILCVCMASNAQNGDCFIRKLTDDTGAILSDSINVSWHDSIHNPRFGIISWTGNIANKLLNGLVLPNWVLNMRAPNSGGVPPIAQAPSYAIGTLFLGTGKAGNVWIVNKDNTRDISMLWNGKQGRWCTNELEYKDHLTAGPHKPVTLGEVLTFINNTPRPNAPPALPAWAQVMILTPHKPIGPSSKAAASMNASVAATFVKTGLMTPRMGFTKTLDTNRESCDHQYVFAKGFNRDYEFCAKCNIKRDLKF
jgi:hypothetical protein